MQELVFVEEVPTPEFPFVDCRAMNDVYLDTEGMLHILYTRQGKSTGGVFKRYHAIYKNDGTSLYDGELTVRKSRYCRIFQDKNLRYFILDDNGMIYRLDKKAKTQVDSVQINLKNYSVNFAGYGLTVPRTGSKLSNKMDIVFPSHDGRYYVYFQLKLDDVFPLKIDE